MAEIRFEYRCRRCDQIDNSTGTGAANDSVVIGWLMQAIYGNTEPSMLTVHSCEDNGYGIADLIGCTPRADQH